MASGTSTTTLPSARQINGWVEAVICPQCKDENGKKKYSWEVSNVEARLHADSEENAMQMRTTRGWEEVFVEGFKLRFAEK